MHAIFRIDPKSGNRTLISDVLHGTGPNFTEPCGVAVEEDGKLLVVNSATDRRRVSHQLYMPALAAMKYNLLIQQWLEGLQQRGQSGKQLVCAAMHRLIRLAVGVLKTGKEFQLDWKGACA